MDYEIQDVAEATYAVIKRTVPFADVSTVMPELMEKVQSWADTVPHGVHMCISSMTPDGQLNITPGVEVDPSSVEPPEGFDLVRRPPQRSAVHLTSAPTRDCLASIRSSTTNCSATGTARKESRSRSTRNTTPYRRRASSGRSTRRAAPS